MTLCKIMLCCFTITCKSRPEVHNCAINTLDAPNDEILHPDRNVVNIDYSHVENVAYFFPEFFT
jgi:hypothetical protein